jgi:hypothetical protein
MRSDGGPQYRSEFDDFCTQFKIIHDLSSPYNSSSNGLAEAGVKNTKYLLKKCINNNEDYSIALSEFRNLPRSDGISPAQLMFGRRTRGQLPMLSCAYDPIDQAEGRERRRKTQALNRAYSDRHTVKHPTIGTGDKVLVQDTISKLWNKKGIILETRENGRSFIINVDGKRKLRNQKYLRLLRELDPKGETPRVQARDQSMHRNLNRQSRDELDPNSKQSIATRQPQNIPLRRSARIADKQQ